MKSQHFMPGTSKECNTSIRNVERHKNQQMIVLYHIINRPKPSRNRLHGKGRLAITCSINALLQQLQLFSSGIPTLIYDYYYDHHHLSLFSLRALNPPDRCAGPCTLAKSIEFTSFIHRFHRQKSHFFFNFFFFQFVAMIISLFVYSSIWQVGVIDELVVW